MSDDTDIITGSGEPVAPPSEHPRVVEIADERSRDQQVRGEFNKGLTLAAFGTEDASDYIKERETQDKFLDGGDLSPEQMREWHERTHAALQRASNAVARARGEVPSSQQSVSEESIPGIYIAPDDPNFQAAVEFNTQRMVQMLAVLKSCLESATLEQRIANLEAHADSSTVQHFHPKVVA